MARAGGQRRRLVRAGDDDRLGRPGEVDDRSDIRLAHRAPSRRVGDQQFVVARRRCKVGRPGDVGGDCRIARHAVAVGHGHAIRAGERARRGRARAGAGEQPGSRDTGQRRQVGVGILLARDAARQRVERILDGRAADAAVIVDLAGVVVAGRRRDRAGAAEDADHRAAAAPAAGRHLVDGVLHGGRGETRCAVVVEQRRQAGVLVDADRLDPASSRPATP